MFFRWCQLWCWLHKMRIKPSKRSCIYTKSGMTVIGAVLSRCRIGTLSIWVTLAEGPSVTNGALITGYAIGHRSLSLGFPKGDSSFTESPMAFHQNQLPRLKWMGEPFYFHRTDLLWIRLEYLFKVMQGRRTWKSTWTTTVDHVHLTPYLYHFVKTSFPNEYNARGRTLGIMLLTKSLFLDLLYPPLCGM